MLFMVSNFICDTKFYLRYQKIFNFKYFLNKGNCFIVYFLHYQLFLYDMKHFFKELSFITSVARMLTISKLTAHVLKTWQNHYKKHGGIHG